LGVLGDLENAGGDLVHAGTDVVKAGIDVTGDTVMGAAHLVEGAANLSGDVLHGVAGFLTGVGDGVEGLFKDLFDHVGGPAELAAQLKQMAQQLEQLGQQLVGDAAKATWQGEAADAFRQHTAQLSQQVSQISTELGDAAGLAAALI